MILSRVQRHSGCRKLPVLGPISGTSPHAGIDGMVALHLAVKPWPHGWILPSVPDVTSRVLGFRVCAFLHPRALATLSVCLSSSFVFLRVKKELRPLCWEECGYEGVAQAL